MKIGLYGMPEAGKTYILGKNNFIDSLEGSSLLRKLNPEFASQDKYGKEKTRKTLARNLMGKESFIMDGHYSFGEDIVFTEEDGMLYDVFIYLYASPEQLKDRMKASARNQKYLAYDIEKWQNNELTALREYCHNNDKDFYVIDNPPTYTFEDIERIIHFIQSLVDGYSCVSYAKLCTDDILNKCDAKIINLLDGDKTLTIEDTSNAVFNYKTHLFDGNHYTGYQVWKQYLEFLHYSIPKLTDLPIHINTKVKDLITKDSYIVSSGHSKIWKYLSKQMGIECYCGKEMSAETKYFIAKFLQRAGKKVIAYGDSMSDYYMLKQADAGYLISREDGSISRSLKRKDLEGLTIV